MISVRSIRALKVLVPVVSAITLATQLTAVLTNQWLHTVESQPNPNYEKFTMPAEAEFFKKHTVSGLWTLCHNDPPDSEMKCFQIDYFSQEEYIPDQNDSTMAIPYAVKKAAVYIMMATILMALGQSIYFLSQICRYRRIYIFISGIPFVLAGLLILTGIVVYISTFKGEVGYKLRPISQFQDAIFDYRYGYSFLFLVASLLLSELTGTLTIFLYVSQKHFKIMIDTERDEVLKHNIINILRHQQPLPPIPKIIPELIPVDGQPRLRIINEDYSSGMISNSPEPSPTTQNHNFLTADFGVNSAFYQCGRHGSRGRRNSRSNDSYLGSPRQDEPSQRPMSQSRKVSQCSDTDNPNSNSHQQSSNNLQENKSINNDDTDDRGKRILQQRNSSSIDDDLDLELDLNDIDLVSPNSGRPPPPPPRELRATRLLNRQMSTDLEIGKIHHQHHPHRRRFLLQSHQQAFSFDEPYYHHQLHHENPIVPFILASSSKKSTPESNTEMDINNYRGAISNRSTLV